MTPASRELDVIADAPEEVRAAANIVHSWFTKVEKSRTVNVASTQETATLRASPNEILAVAGSGPAIDCYRRVTFVFRCSPIDAVRALERLSSSQSSPLGWNPETKSYFRRSLAGMDHKPA